MRIRIKENSLLAKLAAHNLREARMAIVLGKTIHLYNVSREDFLQNTKWVRHEVMHVKQFQQNGYCKFILSYLFETFNVGYKYNKYEKEARDNEGNLALLDGVHFD